MFQWKTKDAQLAAGFGGHLCYLRSPGKVIDDNDAYNFKRLNIFQWLIMEIGRSVRRALSVQQCGVG